ncbi:hypothetical protein ASD8599_02077 [Ascidiaceihabitans donghaensis]|uniref:Uncharacterized protein n=1 Tax=Ascidiaceihabitans donghaensis TaxID=1510460 RepID=A0A2R8BE26_9RHOB|nr:hypothetical protein ASD8599_02077 [Ascidiaceihabitans donghaensis]
MPSDIRTPGFWGLVIACMLVALIVPVMFG